MGLFLDLIDLSASATDGALEYIYKAHHDHDSDGIWKPHDSPFLKLIVELFTKRGLDRLGAVKDHYLGLLSGARHKASTDPSEAPPSWQITRWSDAERALARLYIESLPVEFWTLEDHMIAIEYVVQNHLPPDALVAESDWLTVKSAMMGKVQANLEHKPTGKQAEAIVAAMPSSFVDGVPLGPTAAAVLKFAQARAAENVRALSENVRHRMRSIVVADLEQQFVGGAPAGTSSLQTKLLDAFGELNRDWRRIAVTEAGEAQTQGFIASLKIGSKVKRVEQYANACAFCRKIDGRTATVVPADQADKDPETMVWVGKNNIGRSASPRKRVGDTLVERTADEMWQLPAGLVHPHCRGRWVLVEDAPEPGDDPAFAAQLREILGAS